MTRYIDADALKEVIANHVYLVSDSINSRDYGMFWTGGIEKAIDEQPTADVVEPNRGEWKREVLGSTSGYGTTVMYQCSNCEKMAMSEYHYCPNCGADMRKEGDAE